MKVRRLTYIKCRSLRGNWVSSLRTAGIWFSKWKAERAAKCRRAPRTRFKVRTVVKVCTLSLPHQNVTTVCFSSDGYSSLSIQFPLFKHYRMNCRIRHLAIAQISNGRTVNNECWSSVVSISYMRKLLCSQEVKSEKSMYHSLRSLRFSL